MREAKLSQNETNAEATAPTLIDWVWRGSKGTEADGTESGGGADGRGENCTSLYNYETNYDNKINFLLKYKMTDTTKNIFVRRSSETWISICLAFGGITQTAAEQTVF